MRGTCGHAEACAGQLIRREYVSAACCAFVADRVTNVIYLALLLEKMDALLFRA